MSEHTQSNVVFFPSTRFCVVGWTSEESLENEGMVARLKAYCEQALMVGLSCEEITEDVLDSSDAAFEAVDVDLVKTRSGGRVLSVICIAAGRGDLLRLESCEPLAHDA